MKTAPSTECHKYGSNVNMKIAVVSFVDDSSSSVNQYRNQRHHLNISLSGIPRMKIGKLPNKSKISVMHSYDF
jgi:hypothetical protein